MKKTYLYPFKEHRRKLEKLIREKPDAIKHQLTGTIFAEKNIKHNTWLFFTTIY